MGKESAEKNEWSSQPKYFICKNEMITPQTKTLDKAFSWAWKEMASPSTEKGVVWPLSIICTYMIHTYDNTEFI